MRRAGLLGALLCTALMLLLFPGMIRSLRMEDENRMNVSLRPEKSITLTLWIVGTGEDQRLISRVISKYEKENKNIRIYVRKAMEEELYRQDALLPDIVLYTTGSVLEPEAVFIPLKEAEKESAPALLSGKSRGIQYGIPLWFSPNILSLPEEWLQKETAEEGRSLLGFGTPQPPSEERLTWEEVPWEKLCQENMLHIAPGCAMQQMLMQCPKSRWNELAAHALVAGEEKLQADCAYAGSYRQHRAEKGRIRLLLLPVVSHEVRYGSLCSESEEAKALLDFFQKETAAQEAADYGWLPLWSSPGEKDPLLLEAWGEAQKGIYLPNAYAATKKELEESCKAGFIQTADPVETLLKLR